jgi:hypothetical protein
MRLMAEGYGDQVCNGCGRLIEEAEWCVPVEKAAGVPGWFCKDCFDSIVAIITG